MAEHKVRVFQTGATRNLDDGKLDFEGFLSPAVLMRFAEYMHKNRIQRDGARRDGDNWQRGIPKDAYIKSGLRHVLDWWLAHRGLEGRESVEEALCAVIFNASGYLFELLRERRAYTSEGLGGKSDETRKREISNKAQALASRGAGKLARVIDAVRPGRRATASRYRNTQKARL
jgi:hypothetical protein